MEAVTTKSINVLGVKNMERQGVDKNWEALAEVFMAQQSRAFHLAIRILGNRSLAEDALQNANLKAMHHSTTSARPSAIEA